MHATPIAGRDLVGIGKFGSFVGLQVQAFSLDVVVLKFNRHHEILMSTL